MGDYPYIDALGLATTSSTGLPLSMMSSTRAKQMYCLSDEEIARLPSSTHANPHNKYGSPMVAYEKVHLYEAAVNKFNGEDGWNEHLRVKKERADKRVANKRDRAAGISPQSKPSPKKSAARVRQAPPKIRDDEEYSSDDSEAATPVPRKKKAKRTRRYESDSDWSGGD